VQLGSIIYKRRKELGMTLEELGNAVGVSKSTVKKWESGIIANMRSDKIAELARALNLDPWILIGAEEGGSHDVDLRTKKIPVLGTIACGAPIYAQENIEDYVAAAADCKADFALKCKGDSMIGARIYDGDLVFIKEQPQVENGEIAAVVIGDEATLKRVYCQKDMITLVAANPAYEPMVFSGSELDGIRILGKAVFFVGKL